MPQKRRPSRRRRPRQPGATPRLAAAPRFAAPPSRSTEAAMAAPSPAPASMRERAAARFTARDYGYVRRELLRIALLATAVLVAIVVLSFFLP